MRTTRKTKKTPGLADVLFGQNRGRVLGLLFGNPDKPLYVRQIARTIGASAGAIAPELDLLTQVGLLVSSRSGNLVFYQANRESPIFGELSKLIAKTVGVFQLLRSALEPVADRIVLSFVYGSFARQQETSKSDIDLMVVGKVDLDEVLECLVSVEKQIARQVNPTLYSPSEFKSKLTSESHFVNSVVQRPKVFIIGDEDELRKLGRSEIAQSRSN